MGPEPGDYEGIISDCEMTKVGINETPVIKIGWKVEGGFGDRLIYLNLWLTDTTLQREGFPDKTVAERSIEELMRLGYCGETLSELNDPDKTLGQLFKDTSKVYPLRIEYQKDKNGEIKKDFNGDPFYMVRYVSRSHPKFDYNQSRAAFRQQDALFAKIRGEVPGSTEGSLF